ncbi:MAG: AAA family ATPase [Actinobacteria bacterium]|nr:AAA family ATPase [Actinomycetota bacterium]
MKVAVTGKGGAGKSTISGALSRHLAAQGHEVVAVDGDPNPNLGISLGVARETVESMEPILNALIAVGHTHDDPAPDPEDLLARYGVAAPDGIVLVATGKIERPTDSCLCCGSHMTTRQFFGDLRADDGRIVIADLEAGLNDLLWADPDPDDVVLVVAEPSAKSVEIARRATSLAADLGVKRVLGVANRSAGDDDVARMSEAIGADVVVVPDDPAVEHADHLGRAPFDLDPTSPAMLAIAALATQLLDGA